MSKVRLHRRDVAPADALRARVVTLVLAGILGLTFGLYGLVGLLLVRAGADAVPEALWLAAGNCSGALLALLANSKLGGESGPGPMPVTTVPGESLAVHPAPQPDPVIEQ